MPLSRQEEWFVPEFAEEEVSIATTEMSTDSRFNNSQSKPDEKQENQTQELIENGESEEKQEEFVKPKPKTASKKEQ